MLRLVFWLAAFLGVVFEGNKLRQLSQLVATHFEYVQAALSLPGSLAVGSCAQVYWPE